MIDRINTFLELDVFTQDDLYSTFSLQERLYILYYIDDKKFLDFKKKVNRLELRLLSPEEAYDVATEKETISINGILMYAPEFFAQYLSQKDLYQLCHSTTEDISTYLLYLKDSNYIAKLFDEGVISKNYCSEMLWAMDNTELKIKYMLKYADKEDYYSTIQSIEDDKEKEDALKYLKKSDRVYVITSFKDDSFKEKYISIFAFKRSMIISSLTSDDKKEDYLNKLFPLLTAYEKVEIIASFTNKDLVRKYVQLLKSGNAITAFITINSGTKKYDDIIMELLPKLHKEKHIAEVIMHTHNIRFKTILFQRLRSEKTIIESLGFGSYNNTILTICLDKVSEKNKIKIIRMFKNPNALFDNLNKINPKLIPSTLEHVERFPKYDSKYEYIAKIYANIYKLNLEHLIKLLEVVGCSLFNSIENPNIMHAINLNDEDFAKYMQIINENNLTVTESSHNDTINSIIQRLFRVQNRRIYEFGATLFHAIDDKNTDLIRDLFTEMTMAQVLPREEYIRLYRAIKAGEDRQTIKNELKVYTDKYIALKREQFYHEIMDDNKSNLFQVRASKKAIINLLLAESTNEEIIDELDRQDIYELTKEEMDLVKNHDLINKILEYKRDVSSINLLPEEKKQISKVTNILIKVFEKKVFIRNREQSEFTYEIKPTDLETVISIMKSLDVEMLRKTLFSNQESFDHLISFLDKTRILGWINKYEGIAIPADIQLSTDTIAELINNYDFIKKRIEKKAEEENQPPQYSITKMLDEASVFDTYSQKYSLLFGRENFNLIKTNPPPNSSGLTKEVRIKKALSLIPKMYSRKTIPVPGIDKMYTLENGKKLNVVVGNTKDLINLTLGERTKACMRIGGAGDSLFEYALLGKKGFHITIYDSETNEFISRVSCFRNGNTIFMNQLRNSVTKKYQDIELVEVIKQVASDLIDLTKDSPQPIHNVVISQGYAMESVNAYSTYMGVENVKKGLPTFYSDVDSTAIVLKTSNKDNKLVPVILDKNTPDYTPQRGKIRTYHGEEAAKQVVHYKLLNHVLNGGNIDTVDSFINYDIVTCIAGEDWYVSIDINGKVEEFILKETNNKKLAMAEMKETLQIIKQFKPEEQKTKEIA